MTALDYILWGNIEHLIFKCSSKAYYGAFYPCNYSAIYNAIIGFIVWGYSCIHDETTFMS